MKRFLLFFAALWLTGMAIATPITVRVQKPAEWDAMYLHYWGTSLGETQWPGVQLTPDSLGWCNFTFENDSVVNYIWNNGNGIQTNNLLTRVNVCERLVPPQPHISNPNWEPVAVDCGSLPPIVPDTTSHDTVPQQTSITLGFQAPAEWDSVYIHYWNTSLGSTGWPGVLLTRDSLGWSYFTFPNDQVVNYLWNNGQSGGGTNQTVDLTANCDKCERVGGISAGGNYVISFAECGSRAPWDTITPVVPDTTHQDTIPAPQPQGITVKLAAATVPASWENVLLFCWTPGVDSALNAGYGLVLEADSGWYKYTFPAGIDHVQFLFDNGGWGDYNQTQDYETSESVCFGFGEANNLTNYKFPLVEADCITGEIEPLPVDTGDHVVYIWDNLTRYYYDSIIVPYGEDVTLPTNLPEYEGYHFVFWEGLYDGSNVIRDVRTNLYMQAKYYINLPEEPAQNPVTVRLKGESVPASWEHVYVYSWTAGAMDSIAWPGLEMQMDDNGWYTHTFPAGVQDIDMLFCNGEDNVGNQTVDVDNVSSNLCMEIAAPLSPSGFYMVYPADCGEIEPQGMTIRLMHETNFGGWYFDNYIYAWQHVDSIDIPLLGEWPGVPMNLDDNGWFTYTFGQEYENVNIVFSSHDVQTVDIMGVTESSCFQIGKGKGWVNNMYVHDVKQADCDILPSMCHLVFFMTKDGESILDAQYVVDGDSAVAPDAPLVPGYEFIGWDQDFSHITANITVYPIYRSTAPVDEITVRLIPTNGYGWADVYLYCWAADSLGGFAEPLGSWPGTKIEKDSMSGWHSKTFYDYHSVNIVWNDGSSGNGLTHQTQDLLDVSESTCYRLYGIDSVGHTVADVVACTVNPNIFHTVAFVDQDFDNQLLLMMQEAHGYNLPYVPVAPQHEGYRFRYWVDVATMTEFVPTQAILNDMLVDEVYERLSYMVYMVNWDGEIIASGPIYHGNSVTNVDDFSAYREGYEFIGWSDSLQNITSIRISVAQFRPITDGNTAIIYTDKNDEILNVENVNLNMPEPPTYAGYTFDHWEVISGDIAYGVRVQAVYVLDPITGAPEVNGENQVAKKVIRDDKVYILTPDGKVFSTDGKLVEKQ